MAGYTKLFSDIVASSVWQEDDTTRVVWITMLALKDREHFVRGVPGYLARAANVGQEACDRALARLAGPDENSRSREFGGRRIEAVEGGWRILNGDKYSRMLSKAERDEYNRAKQSEYRKRRKSVVEGGGRAGARGAIREGLEEAQENVSGEALPEGESGRPVLPVRRSKALAPAVAAWVPEKKEEGGA